MGVFDWAPTPALNASTDPNIRASDGVGFKDLPSAVRGIMAATAALALDQGGALVSGGTSNAYSVATNSGIAPRPGATLSFHADRDNTAEPTLNVDGFGPRPWRAADGSSLSAGAIKRGQLYTVAWNASDGASEWRSVGASPDLSGSAVAALNIDLSLAKPNAATRPVAQVISDFSNSIANTKGFQGNGIDFDDAGFANAMADRAGSPIFIPPDKVCKVGGGLTLPAGTSFESTGQAKLFHVADSSGPRPLFKFVNPGTAVRRVIIDCANAGNVPAFDFASAGVNRRIYIEDVDLISPYAALTDEGAGSYVRLYVTRLAISNPRATPINIQRSFAYTYFDDCYIDCATAAPGTTNFPLFVYGAAGLSGPAGGLYMRDFYIGGRVGDTSNANPLQDAYVISDAAAVDLDGVIADTCGGRPFVLTRIKESTFGRLEANLSDGDAITMATCTDVSVEELRIKGRAGQSAGFPAAAGRHGLVMDDSCNGIDIAAVTSRYCTGDGVRLTSPARSGIGRLASRNNTGYGIRTTATGGSFVVSGGGIFDNGAGNLSLAGANHYLRDVMFNSGGVASYNGSGNAGAPTVA